MSKNRQNMASGALMSKEQLNVLYKEYNRKRGKLYSTLQGKGLVYGGSIPKTPYEEFSSNFLGAYGKLVDRGMTPTTTEVLKEMIDNELYTASDLEVKRDTEVKTEEKTYNINSEVLRAYGGFLKTKEDIDNFDLMQVPERYRKDTEELIALRLAIHEENLRLKLKGVKTEDRIKKIGQMFFGSPE